MSVTDLQDAAQDAARTNGASLKEAGEAARNRAAKAKQALQDTARKGAEAARTQAAAAGRRITKMTQEQPVASLSTTLAIGLLAGFTIGLLVGRATAD
jgi:ElaB/YqjD/DUF883 family membrane-anchored ribosome-binding protein